MSGKPKIAVTMGDPNGIGPEVCIRAFYDGFFEEIYDIVFVGSESVLQSANSEFGKDGPLSIIDPTDFALGDIEEGVRSEKAGRASIACIEKAVAMALSGEVKAIVTAPISKRSIHMAGSTYPGHTEMLMDLTGSENVVMLFEGTRFRVAPVTIHVPLREVPDMITEESVYVTVSISARELKKRFGVEDPKIVVCGLNPHAGESGSFGNEEQEHIIPALERARAEGISVEGPLPADTLFYDALRGKWDLVVAMYHDQGFVPFKMLSFDTGVNVTLGLPILRTSPDHGTAFDIAWKGAARPESMIQAIKVAMEICDAR